MLKQLLNRLPRNKPAAAKPDDGGPSNGSPPPKKGQTAAQTNGNLHNPVAANSTNGFVSDGKTALGRMLMPTTTTTPSGPLMVIKKPPTSPPFSEVSLDSALDALLSFQDVAIPDRQALLLKKLNFASSVFDFSTPGKNQREKETKRQVMSDVVDYINTCSVRFPDSVIEAVVKMVSANIFRPPPPPHYHHHHYSAGSGGGKASENSDPEEEEQWSDPGWMHLQMAYEILLRFVLSNDLDVKVAKRYIDQTFLLKLLDLFDSEDMREREFLKTVLHRIYGKFMVHRPFIRKAVSNIFYRFAFETERHHGISELLEVLGTIINGLAMPLKEEHKVFLIRSLIPLHKPKYVTVYHQQLTYCMTQYIEKDYKLADAIIRGLLKYWPVTNSKKEVLFLVEMEEILESIQPAEFQRCMVPLFRQIGHSLNSSHFQVAEQALMLWNNDHIVSLVSQNRKVVLPLILPPLERNNRCHWNRSVHAITTNVRKMFFEMDQELFEECQRKFLQDEENSKALQERRQQIWLRLEAMAGGGN